MARAYIVVARNDVADSLLQTLDLWPNTSLRNSTLDPVGQTHYNTFFLNDGVNGIVSTLGAGPITVSGDTYGLAGYLMANVEVDNVLQRPLNMVEANFAVDLIEKRVVDGLPLRLADIDVILTVATGLPTGLTDGSSTGSVEEILRILAGERYLVLDGSVVGDAVPNFVAGSGYFVTRPNVELPESVRSSGRPVRGLNSFGRPIPTSTPVQSGTQDVLFQDVPVVVETGRLQQSAIDGALSKMASPSFAFQNIAFSYGGAGNAFDLAGDNIGSDYQGRAVTVYAADGTIIV